MFLTLTYTDDAVPLQYDKDGNSYMTLVKSDVQKFFKLLRTRLRRGGSDLKIKYYYCGEYGPKTQRPHYHVILFGLPDTPAYRHLIMSCWPHCDWNNSHIRNKSFGKVRRDSIAYTVGYVVEKMYGDNSKVEYKNKARPFNHSSQAMGLRYFLDNFVEIMQDIGCKFEKHIKPIPRYYLKKIKQKGYELYQFGLEFFDFEKNVEKIKYDNEVKELNHVLTSDIDFDFNTYYNSQLFPERSKLKELCLSYARQWNTEFKAKREIYLQKKFTRTKICLTSV
ncbi:MAG: hypothetical protein FWH53_00565 [Leptospirales bacterium]|nr:hypothetical protein [Leptospirales bacterium]